MKKIGLLMGGLSSEREVSLQSGEYIFNYLDKSKYIVKTVEWLKNNSFKVYKDNNFDEIMTEYENINSLFSNESFDVIFLALHGTDGEDGTIQGFLELINMPYTGSDMKSSLIGMNKYISKLIIKDNNFDTPKYLFKDNSKKVNEFKNEIIDIIGFPCVVKPNSSGSSIGTSIVKNDKELMEALNVAEKEDSEVLVEEYIDGTEITIAILEDKGEVVALPIVEIVTEAEFFDYESKYDMSRTKEIIPARIDKEIEKEAKKLAINVHKTLGCNGYSRLDVLIKDNKLYIMEINTLPGFTKESLFPKVVKVGGYKVTEVLDLLIESSICGG